MTGLKVFLCRLLRQLEVAFCRELVFGFAGVIKTWFGGRTCQSKSPIEIEVKDSNPGRCAVDQKVQQRRTLSHIPRDFLSFQENSHSSI